MLLSLLVILFSNTNLGFCQTKTIVTGFQNDSDGQASLVVINRESLEVIKKINIGKLYPYRLRILKDDKNGVKRAFISDPNEGITVVDLNTNQVVSKLLEGKATCQLEIDSSGNVYVSTALSEVFVIDGIALSIKHQLDISEKDGGRIGLLPLKNKQGMYFCQVSRNLKTKKKWLVLKQFVDGKISVIGKKRVKPEDKFFITGEPLMESSNNDRQIYVSIVNKLLKYDVDRADFEEIDTGINKQADDSNFTDFSASFVLSKINKTANILVAIGTLNTIDLKTGSIKRTLIGNGSLVEDERGTLFANLQDNEQGISTLFLLNDGNIIKSIVYGNQVGFIGNLVLDEE